MSTARDTLVAALAGLMPAGLVVIPYARNIDPPSRPTVLVRVDEVLPSPAAPRAQRIYTFALVIVPAKAQPGPADDELDGALEDVLHALDQGQEITWSRAVRGTYEETKYPAYEVTIQLHGTITPPATPTP